MSDRLDILRARYVSQIDDLQSKITKITQKVAVLDELKAEADSLPLETKVSASTKNPSMEENAFAASGLTEAIMRLIVGFGTRPFTPPQVRDRLLELGFKPQGKNFGISVGTSLKRLSLQGRIVKDHLNGKTVYRAKP